MESSGYEWLPKAVLYVLVQLAAGFAVVRWLVALAWSEPSSHVNELDRRLSRSAALVACLIVVVLLARGWVHTATAFGFQEALVWENIRLVTLESRWGASWRLQCYAALALVGASLLTRRSRWGWTAYACAVLGLCGVVPLLGHGAGSTPQLALHAIHIAGGSIWLGSLCVLVAVRRMRGTQPFSGAGSRPLEAHFSPIALAAAALVVATGLAAAWIYLGAAEQLFSTTYGRLLLLKMACVCGVVACGWLNWRRVRMDVEPKMAVMSIEVVFALAVVVATSVLTETEHP